MAPFNPRPGWDVVFSFRDNNGNVARTSIAAASGFLFNDVNDAALLLATALEAISSARVIDYSINRTYQNSVTTTPPAESDVRRKLKMPFGTAEFPDVLSLEIPSPVFTIETPGTDIVDVANTLVANVINAVVDGPVGLANGFVTYYGADLTRAGTPFLTTRTRKGER